MAALTEIEGEIRDTGETQISLTHLDARPMMSRGSGILGYNVQSAVDSKHHSIVEYNVTNNASDRDHLSGIARKTRAAIGSTTLTAIADRGYFNGKKIPACHEAGIHAQVPKTKTSNAKLDCRFDKADFIYGPEKNEYRCTAGQALIRRLAGIEKGMKNNRYCSSNCQGCPLNDQCTLSRERRVTQWEHQDALDDMQTRFDQNPDAMRIRRSSVEHAYGTIRSWMGAAQFLTKALARVKTEMSLHVLAHNLKRMMVILSIAIIMAAIGAYARISTRFNLFWPSDILDKQKLAKIRDGPTRRFLVLAI